MGQHDRVLQQEIQLLRDKLTLLYRVAARVQQNLIGASHLPARLYDEFSSVLDVCYGSVYSYSNHSESIEHTTETINLQHEQGGVITEWAGVSVTKLKQWKNEREGHFGDATLHELIKFFGEPHIQYRRETGEGEAMTPRERLRNDIRLAINHLVTVVVDRKYDLATHEKIEAARLALDDLIDKAVLAEPKPDGAAMLRELRSWCVCTSGPAFTGGDWQTAMKNAIAKIDELLARAPKAEPWATTFNEREQLRKENAELRAQLSLICEEGHAGNTEMAAEISRLQLRVEKLRQQLDAVREAAKP